MNITDPHIRILAEAIASLLREDEGIFVELGEEEKFLIVNRSDTVKVYESDHHNFE